MFLRPYLFGFSLIFLLIGLPAFAQVRSSIGDKSLYYCKGHDGNGGIIRRVKGDRKITYLRAAADVKAKIRKTQKDIERARKKKQAISSLRKTLKMLQTTLADLTACYEDGTTGKPEVVSPPPSTIDACAVAGATEIIRPMIVNGNQCNIGDSPVVYVLITDEEEEQFECTGTVVALPGETQGHIVITAAHCAEGAIAMEIQTPEGMLEASDFAIFPDWDLESDNFEIGDVAVLLFDEYIPTKAAHIAPSDIASAGMSGVIAGYGLDENGESSPDILRAGKATIAEVTSGHLVLHYTGKESNTCIGDSGGPLFLKSESEWYLAGVTSNGIEEDCGPGDISTFANIRNPDVAGFVNEFEPGLIP